MSRKNIPSGRHRRKTKSFRGGSTDTIVLTPSKPDNNIYLYVNGFKSCLHSFSNIHRNLDIQMNDIPSPYMVTRNFLTNLKSIGEEDIYLVKCDDELNCENVNPVLTKYKMMNDLASGSYGKVSLCKNNTCEQFAIKEIRDKIDSIKYEIILMLKIQKQCSEYMICIKDHGYRANNSKKKFVYDSDCADNKVFNYYDKDGKKCPDGKTCEDGRKEQVYPPYFVVMEDLSDWKTVTKFVNSYNNSENIMIDLINQLVKGLFALHEARISHFDIKDNNIMCKLDNGKVRVKYIDLGLSILSRDCNNSDVMQKLKFGEDTNILYNSDNNIKCFKSDYWMLGILIAVNILKLLNEKDMKHVFNHNRNDREKYSKLFLSKEFINRFNNHSFIRRCSYDFNVFIQDSNDRTISLKKTPISENTDNSYLNIDLDSDLDLDSDSDSMYKLE